MTDHELFEALAKVIKEFDRRSRAVPIEERKDWRDLSSKGEWMFLGIGYALDWSYEDTCGAANHLLGDDS